MRLTGPEIAEGLGMPTSTVSAVLGRIGLGRLSRLEPPEPVRHYERARPGELIHIDVKKLGRIGPDGPGHSVLGRGWAKAGARQVDAAGVPRSRTGWERVHICVDDVTRLAYVEVLPDEKATTAVGFLRRAIARGAAAGERDDPGAKMALCEVLARDPRYTIDVVSTIEKLDEQGFIHEVVVHGFGLAQMEHAFRGTPDGMLDENCRILPGSRRLAFLDRIILTVSETTEHYRAEARP